MHYFWIAVAAMLLTAGTLLFSPLAGNTTGETRRSNVVETDGIAVEREQAMYYINNTYLDKTEELATGDGVIGNEKVTYYKLNEKVEESSFLSWVSWNSAGILFITTMFRVTRKIEEMEQIEWNTY